MVPGVRTWLAVLVATALAGEPLSAEDAASPLIAVADPFSALVGDKARADGRRAGEVQRFAVAADGRMFLVEGKVGAARLKYLCGDGDERPDCTLDPEAYAEEIFLATGARGPRGDIIYKGEDGSALLRIMSYGGATVFWPGKSNGEAASRTRGDDSPLALPPAGPPDVARRAELATRRLSALAGETIRFSTQPAPPAAAADLAASEDASVLADAIIRAVAGMEAVAGDATGRRVLGARIVEVRFEEASGPGLALKGKTLTIGYDPEGDAAGRPSSRAVREFLENSL
jgi:hypothetical protein